MGLWIALFSYSKGIKIVSHFKLIYLPLPCRREREAAFQAIRYPLKALPAAEKEKQMEIIRQQFPAGETARLLRQFPSLQMLTWEEIRQLAAAGVEIGSHGVNHEIHHEHQPAEVRLAELTGSKTCLEDNLGRACRAFAFPNGNFLATSPAELAAAGYDLGFTTSPGLAAPGTDPYLLPRLEPPASLAKLAMEIFFSGAKVV